MNVSGIKTSVAGLLCNFSASERGGSSVPRAIIVENFMLPQMAPTPPQPLGGLLRPEKSLKLKLLLPPPPSSLAGVRAEFT